MGYKKQAAILTPACYRKHVNALTRTMFVCLFDLFLARQPPIGPRPPHSRGFLDHTHTLTHHSR